MDYSPWVAKSRTRLSGFHFQSIHTHTHTHTCITTCTDETKETLFVVLGGCMYIGAHFSLKMPRFISSSWSQHIHSLKFIHSKSV